MTYSEEISKRIHDSDQWPSFSRPDFLTDLERIANRSYKSRDTSGYLAAILIYHQLCEEMIWLLIECSDFFIQVAVFPAEIHFQNDKSLMFGQLLGKLDNTIEFPKKAQFIGNCKEMNKIRKNFVHKLTLKSSVEDIKKLATDYKLHYDQLSIIFMSAYDYFRVCFKDLKKDGEWQNPLPQ